MDRATDVVDRPGAAAAEALPAERARLAAADSGQERWRFWGPYLSERQWGTVREDYSPYGNAWDYFPHDHARSRAYRWGEDGIAGISDDQQRLCLALALWNGKDPILKERLFGLTNGEGNHSEDVKELYYYLDATPTHSYLKFLYKYPQAAVPLRPSGRGEPAPRQGRPRVRADRHRRLRGRPLLRRRGRVRQGLARRHSDAGHGPQSRARAGEPRRAAAALVPQHVVLEGRRAPPRPLRRQPTGSACRAASSATIASTAKARPSSCSATTTPTPAASTAWRTPTATSRTASTTMSWPVPPMP